MAGERSSNGAGGGRGASGWRLRLRWIRPRLRAARRATGGGLSPARARERLSAPEQARSGKRSGSARGSRALHRSLESERDAAARHRGSASLLLLGVLAPELGDDLLLLAARDAGVVVGLHRVRALAG